MKWVLGWDCLEYEDNYRVITKIFSHFVMSMLDIGIPKPLVLKLVQEIFPKKYLNGLGEVVANVAYGVGFPMTSNLKCYIEEEVIVSWLPFLSRFRLQSQNEHCHLRVTHAFHFLFFLYNMVVLYDIEWYTDFRNLVFSLPLAAIPVDIAKLLLVVFLLMKR